MIVTVINICNEKDSFITGILSEAIAKAKFVLEVCVSVNLAPHSSYKQSSDLT